MTHVTMLTTSYAAKNGGTVGERCQLGGQATAPKKPAAKAIDQNSLRAGKPFVTVNCGALPETLAESELFGHRKGSFTGANSDRAGKFEAANEGTVFLDEAGELTLPLQVKLLRVVQEREVDKIGDPHPVKVNVRIPAASNRNLKNLVEDGDFREDLYHRLSVVTIELPPLRERRDDVEEGAIPDRYRLITGRRSSSVTTTKTGGRDRWAA